MSPAFLLKRWERFWFEDVPSEAFSLVRIAIGAAGLVSLLGFTPVAMFWAPDGLAPIPPQSGIRALVLESGLGGTAGWAIFLTLLTGFACMTAGLFTGSSVMLCFIGSVIQTRWNSMPLSAAHSLLMATLFCLAWADCGTRLSVDDWRRRRRRDAHSDWTGAGARNDQTATQPIWPLRLIRAQIAVLYLTSGLYKLLGPSWRDGTAVYHSTHQNIYGRVLNVYPLSPGLDWVLTVLTYATVVWEFEFSPAAAEPLDTHCGACHRRRDSSGCLGDDGSRSVQSDDPRDVPWRFSIPARLPRLHRGWSRGRAPGYRHQLPNRTRRRRRSVCLATSRH